MGDGLRLALTLLTIIPVRARRIDRQTAARAMALAPVAGLIVGSAAAAMVVLGGRLGYGSGLSAALAVAVMAGLTRGLHLDGLADVADGLGSRRPPAEALKIMKRSDIGPFGVVTLVLTLLIQTAALAQAGATAAVVAAVTGRLAATWACRTAVPAARSEGLGVLVAGTVRPVTASVATAVVIALAAAAGLLTGHGGGAVVLPLAVLAGLGAARALEQHAVRRLGGITGDVFGALIEIAVSAALLVACLA